MSVQKSIFCCLLLAVLAPLAGNAQQPTPADPAGKRENENVSASRKALEEKLDRLLKEIEEVKRALQAESGGGQLLAPLVPAPKAPANQPSASEAVARSELDTLWLTVNRLHDDVETVKADLDRMAKDRSGTREGPAPKSPPPAAPSLILWIENQMGTEQEVYVNNVLYRIGARQNIPLAVSGRKIVYQLWPYERPMSLEFGPLDRERRLIIQSSPRGLGSLWSVNQGVGR